MEATKNEVLGPYDKWSMVVLYDPKTGDIVHTHQAVTTRGGTHPDDTALEKEAAEHAARIRSASVAGMGFLNVDPSTVELNTRYAVDLKNRSLVKAAPRARKA